MDGKRGSKERESEVIDKEIEDIAIPEEIGIDELKMWFTEEIWKRDAQIDELEGKNRVLMETALKQSMKVEELRAVIARLKKSDAEEKKEKQHTSDDIVA